MVLVGHKRNSPLKLRKIRIRCHKYAKYIAIFKNSQIGIFQTGLLLSLYYSESNLATTG